MRLSPQAPSKKRSIYLAYRRNISSKKVVRGNCIAIIITTTIISFVSCNYSNCSAPISQTRRYVRSTETHPARPTEFSRCRSSRLERPPIQIMLLAITGYQFRARLKIRGFCQAYATTSEKSVEVSNELNRTELVQ